MLFSQAHNEMLALTMGVINKKFVTKADDNLSWVDCFVKCEEKLKPLTKMFDKFKNLRFLNIDGVKIIKKQVEKFDIQKHSNSISNTARSIQNVHHSRTNSSTS